MLLNQGFQIIEETTNSFVIEQLNIESPLMMSVDKNTYKISLIPKPQILQSDPNVQVEEGDIQGKHSESTNNIQIAKKWLALLKTDKTEILEALSFMASEVNFDGSIITENNDIQKKLAYLRKKFTDSSMAITFTNFKELDKTQIEQFMTNSKHSRKYNLSKDKIDSMILFHLHAVFKWNEEENVDGVFLGFDSKKKIVSFFD